MNAPDCSGVAAKRLILLHKFDIAGNSTEIIRAKDLCEIAAIVVDLSRRNFKWPVNREKTKIHEAVVAIVQHQSTKNRSEGVAIGP